MTKSELKSKIPDILYHKTWGYAELEFIQFPNADHRVGVLYRHENKSCSYGTIATSWQELYNDLAPFLKQKGHM